MHIACTHLLYCYDVIVSDTRIFDLTRSLILDSAPVKFSQMSYLSVYFAVFQLHQILENSYRISLVVILFSRYDVTSDTLRTYLAQYGCTAELRSIREEEVNGVQTVVGIALGRQRFEIMELRPQVNG